MEKNLKKKENEGKKPNRIKIWERKSKVRVFIGDRLSHKNEKLEIEMVERFIRQSKINPKEPIEYKEK